VASSLRARLSGRICTTGARSFLADFVDSVAVVMVSSRRQNAEQGVLIAHLVVGDLEHVGRAQGGPARGARLGTP
jgi:hypothetical protein